MSRTPTLPETIAGAIEDALSEMHTCLPARVESYDSASQTASVQPLIRMGYADEDGNRATDKLPVINRVPVVFQRSGGYGLTFPLVKGDTVLLVFSESSLDKWINEGGGPLDPIDDRRFDLADAIAIPGLFPAKAPTDQVDASAAVLYGDVKLGSKDASDPVALKSDLDALKTYLDAHIHPDPSSGFTGVPTVASPSPVSATKVKAK